MNEMILNRRRFLLLGAVAPVVALVPPAEARPEPQIVGDGVVKTHVTPSWVEHRGTNYELGYNWVRHTIMDNDGVEWHEITHIPWEHPGEPMEVQRDLAWSRYANRKFHRRMRNGLIPVRHDGAYTPGRKA